MIDTPGKGLTALGVVSGAFADAPASARRSVVIGLGAWLVLMVAQAFDSARGSGTAAAVEFLSALCGSAGGILLALAGVLRASAEKATGERRRGPDTDRYRRVLLALPALGLCAGTLLAAAVALMIVRAILGAELPFVLILTGLYAFLLWMSAATVTSATHVLYAHAQLEAETASAARVAAGEAQLAALQARMNPHFLFNALNTVASLVRTEPMAAERVTEGLSGVLRMTLERSAVRMSTLDAEVQYVRAWLAVEQERWKGRLRLQWEIDPATLGAQIPPLMVQPLVENALRHGLGARMDGGTISVSATRRGNTLQVRVQDDGVGFPRTHVEGTGLGNLRQRLSAVYGEAGILSIEPQDHGASVTIEVPFQESHAGAGR